MRNGLGPSSLHRSWRVTGGGHTPHVQALNDTSTKDVASLNRDLPLIPEEPQVGRLVHLRVCLKLPASSVVNRCASSLDS